MGRSLTSLCLLLYVCKVHGDLGQNDVVTTEAPGTNKSTCYPELGCFSMESPWYTLRRPFPAPKTPQEIDTGIYYYSRTSPQRFNISLWPTINLNGADFKSDRPATAFITHGFSSCGNNSWLDELKDSYLKRVDANVFIVDWGKGAQKQNYLQVASNTRIVGAEVARFVQWLIDNYNLKTSSIHLMGHSLGAHICAYVGKKIPNVFRLTGFDPAQPGFETAGIEVRLDKDDADFVEILHTNSLPFIPLLGFGLMNPRGDVDFYINGGTVQPGCKPAINIIKDLGKGLLHLESIKDLFHHTVEELSSWVGCSHGRSYLYYTESLNSNCTLWGHRANLFRRLMNAGTTGFLEPLFASLENCTVDTCLPLGLDAPFYKARGPFAVSTSKTPPYCNYDITENKVLLGIQKTVIKTKEIAHKIKNGFKKIGDSLVKAFSNVGG